MRRDRTADALRTLAQSLWHDSPKRRRADLDKAAVIVNTLADVYEDGRRAVRDYETMESAAADHNQRHMVPVTSLEERLVAVVRRLLTAGGTR